MREMRWRDRSRTVHAMSMSVDMGRGYSGSVWCITVCGMHNATITFKHPKYCPRPVNCLACIGYIPTLPR